MLSVSLINYRQLSFDRLFSAFADVIGGAGGDTSFVFTLFSFVIVIA